MRKSLKPPHKLSKGSIWVIAVTAVFLIAGIVCTIIGFQNEIWHFLGTTGIVLLVIALVPIGVIVFGFINKKIDS